MLNKTFICSVFLADGKHISQTEVCGTASEAMARATAWRKNGHKAQAYLQVIDLDTLEIKHLPLEN